MTTILDTSLKHLQNKVLKDYFFVQIDMTVILAITVPPTLFPNYKSAVHFCFI